MLSTSDFPRREGADSLVGLSFADCSLRALAAPSLRGRAGGEAAILTHDSPIGLGLNGDLVANTPRRSLPPRRGGRTVRPFDACLLAENHQISQM